MTIQQLREKARALPKKPGVYIMQDAASVVIYVGKAKALKNRVSQYFQASAAHTEKTRAMVAAVDHFDVIVTESEFEALVLECSLIKRHQPRYNILLKDGKGYPYIRLTVKEDYPRFSLVGRAADDGARYFGPYGSRGSSQGIIDALCTALKLPTCSRIFPRDIGKGRPCLNHHMGKCDGYCRAEMDQSRYGEGISQAVRLLDGKLGEVVADLNAGMEAAAERLEFEHAAQLRDRLRAIELLSKRQKAVAGTLADTDVVGYHRGAAKSCFVVLHYLDGELAAKDMQLLETPLYERDDEAVSALVGQYYSVRTRVPGQILLPCELEDGDDLERLFSENTGRKVSLVTPQRGGKTELVRLANTNAAEEVARATTQAERQSKLMEALGKMLGLSAPPNRMEAYDISNTGGANIVASMTVFEQGRPKKKDYRHFKLKELDGPDDYGAMREVLTRRFKRHLDGDSGFGAMPDLLLIDGGVNHARAAVGALEAMGLAVPTFGMVKDDRHRTRGLVSPDGLEIGIQAIPALFALIGQIQEETHRFAIEFHRAQRSKSAVGSALDAIEGVGPTRRGALLKHFKSVKAIRTASEEALGQVVPKNTAKAVYEYFHKA